MDSDIITDNRMVHMVILSGCLSMCFFSCMTFLTYKSLQYLNLQNNLQKIRKLEAYSINFETLILLLSFLVCISDFVFWSKTYMKACCFLISPLTVLIIITQKTTRGKEKTVKTITDIDYIKKTHKSILYMAMFFSTNYLLRTFDMYILINFTLSNYVMCINNPKNPYNANFVSSHHVTYQTSGSHYVIDSKHGNTFADTLELQHLLVTPLTFHGERYYANVRCNNEADYYNSSLNIGLKCYIRMKNSTLNLKILDRLRCSISVQDSMPFTEMTFYGINNVIPVKPGAILTFEPKDFFKLQSNDTITYKINNQSVHKIQEKHFLAGCSIFSYLYKTIQNWLEAVTGLVDRKNDLQKSLDICVPYNAMGYLSVNVKREVTLDDHTYEINLIWTAYILPHKTLPWFKTYLPPNVSSTNAEWLYWQEVNQDAVLHWLITLLYEFLFCVFVTALFIILLIYTIIRQFRNLRRFLKKRKKCITGLTFDFIILTSERDNEAVDCVIVSPLKQFGYKVCFPPIDALPGGSRITTLFRLADKSSKFILVTSPNFKEGSFEWRFMYEALVAQRYVNYELAYTDVIVVGLRGNVRREITHTLNKVKIINNFSQLTKPRQYQELLKISSDFKTSGFYFASMLNIIDWCLMTFPDIKI